MSVYQTEQKKMIIDFMTLNRDKNFTIEEIEKHLSSMPECNICPSKSTIYRTVKLLTEEGSLKKFVSADSRRATYQLVKGEHCESHLHLKCTDCGKLFHMDERESDKLLRRISAISDFSVSEEETVIYGRCSLCNKK